MDDRQCRAKACWRPSSCSISSPYRYTPIAYDMPHTLVHNIMGLDSTEFTAQSLLLLRLQKLSVQVLTYLVMNKEEFNIFICRCIFMLDYQLTPTMFYLQIHRHTVSTISKALYKHVQNHVIICMSRSVWMNTLTLCVCVFVCPFWCMKGSSVSCAA